MSTPLYDALTQFAAQSPLRMAMPGHKGKPIPGLPAEYARLDFTELPPTGNLYGEDMDCIAQAEQAWAEAWGADSCLFLTGGSTQGVHTMLLLSDSDTVLTDRVSHRSIHTRLAHPSLAVRRRHRWPLRAGSRGSSPKIPPGVQDSLRHLPHLLRRPLRHLCLG